MSTSNTQPPSDFERAPRQYPPEAYQRNQKVDLAYSELAKTIKALGWIGELNDMAEYLEAQPKTAPEAPVVATEDAEIIDLDEQRLVRLARGQAQPAKTIYNPLFGDAA